MNVYYDVYTFRNITPLFAVCQVSRMLLRAAVWTQESRLLDASAKTRSRKETKPAEHYTDGNSPNFLSWLSNTEAWLSSATRGERNRVSTQFDEFRLVCGAAFAYAVGV